MTLELEIPQQDSQLDLETIQDSVLELEQAETIITNTSQLINDGEDGTHPYLFAHQDISGKENVTNKVTSISSASTDVQYPSAKCVYDIVGNIEATLDAIRGV